MACQTRSAKDQEFHFLIENIHLTCGYITRAFLYDQLFALLFIKHKREETVLDILTYMQLSTVGLLLVINSVVG